MLIQYGNIYPNHESTITMEPPTTSMSLADEMAMLEHLVSNFNEKGWEKSW